jgi:hypothetical protein
MSEAPDLSTLPQRMRYAATVLEEAHERNGTTGDWCSRNLIIAAAKWECEERQAHERLVEELAREMFVAGGDRDCPTRERLEQRGYMSPARKLIESGWRKGADA